jgi:hypothetical protein
MLYDPKELDGTEPSYNSPVQGEEEFFSSK